MNEQEKAQVYELTARELGTFAQMRANITVGQARIYGLNVQLEAAQHSLATAQSYFEGALQALLAAHDMDCADLAPDCSKLIRKEK